jgi:HlyD family secretion protein
VPIPPVIDLLDPGSIYVSAPIDEVDAERVHPGQAVRITVDSRPGASFAGRVTRVAPYVLDDLEQNRTVEVEAEPDEPQAAAGVLPGTSADVEVILDRREDVLRLPAAAVADGGRVLVLAGGVLEERHITTGLGNWEWIEVVGGLSEGDTVAVARDSTEIRPGAEAVPRPTPEQDR